MKAENDDLLVYDEDDAVKYIIANLPAEMKESIDDMMVEYVLDVIYDYYDSNGLISEDTTEEASIDEEDMLKFIVKSARKDTMNLTEEQILAILDGEFKYGQSLGIYD